MFVDERAVKAAIEAYRGHQTQETAIRSALTAALPLLQGVKVKALEWVEPSKETNGCWIAKCEIGTYSVVNENGWYAVLDEHAWGTRGFEWASKDLSKDTRQTAFAAAQADYDARIQSAIELSGNPGQPAPSPRAQALEEVAQWHESEAEAYDAEEGGPDVTGRMLAQEHRVSAIAIRALASQPLADGWLPIETAPKDGRAIVILQEGEEYFDYEWFEGAWCMVFYDQAGHYVANRLTNPTHWRPLPSAPGASE